jgi:hypothetical protein
LGVQQVLTIKEKIIGGKKFEKNKKKRGLELPTQF